MPSGDGSTTDPAPEFGRRVRSERQRRGLTQEELADKAGLHSTYVSSVERGLRNVSLRNIVRLAHALDVEPADLLRGV